MAVFGQITNPTTTNISDGASLGSVSSSTDVNAANCLIRTVEFTATGNVTVTTSGTQKRGQTLIFIILNDGTSPRTITFTTGFSASATIIGTINLVATIHFESNGTKFYEVSRQLLLTA